MYQITSIDKYLTKPIVMLANLHDRDVLAQIEAVDRFTAGDACTPGRTIKQLYHRFFRINDLADGDFDLNQRTIQFKRYSSSCTCCCRYSRCSCTSACAVHALKPLLSGSPFVRVENARVGDRSA